MFKFIIKKIDFAIPLLVMGFSIYVIYHNVGSGIINYVDHQFPFDFKELLRKQLFTWNDRIYLGFDQSLSILSNLSYTILFSFIQAFKF